MSQQWEKVAKIKFDGERFEDHALDHDSLLELAQYLNIVNETAMYLWRAEHPNRFRLPKGFEQGLQLKVRQIEEGSAVPLLETPVYEGLVEGAPHHYIVKAVEETHKIYDAIAKKRPLPEGFPSNLLSDYAKLGGTLTDHESMGIFPSGHDKPARITKETYAYSLTLLGTEYRKDVHVSGMVQEINAKQHQFQIWPDDRTSITVTYTPEQEEEIIKALQERNSRKIHVSGKGEYNKQGILLRVVEVNHLVPIVPSKPRPKFGSAKGKIKMEPDFDAPLRDFKDYM